jgi:hypothetical protein
MSKTYFRYGARGFVRSMSAIPFEPRVIQRPNRSFQNSIFAQALASGRCA